MAGIWRKRAAITSKVRAAGRSIVVLLEARIGPLSDESGPRAPAVSISRPKPVPSPPHATQLRPDIDRLAIGEARPPRPALGAGPGGALEMSQARRRNEAGARGIDVALAVAALLLGGEA